MFLPFCFHDCVFFTFFLVKDSNAPEMVHMLKVLGPLQQQILPHINEWEVHNDLQKILDVIDMLLTLPSDTPLAKVVIMYQNCVCHFIFLQ